MERYDTPPTPDLFASSTNFYNTLVAELQNPATGWLPHHELEELLDSRGRLLLRQLLQDHLDLRALREEETARTRPPVVVGPDRLARPRLEQGHQRQLATLFGTLAAPVRLAAPRGGQCLPGRYGPVAAQTAALLLAGAAGRPGIGTGLLRHRDRGDHPPLRASDR